MSKLNLENLHRNKKLAFIDGFLTGIAVYKIATMFWEDYREMKAEDQMRAAEHLEYLERINATESK